LRKSHSHKIPIEAFAKEKEKKMLRRASRQAPSILPEHGGGNPSSTCYFGYGSSGWSGYDNSYSRSRDSSPYFAKRRPSYSSSDFLPSVVKKSSSWLALGLGFFVLLVGYYQSKFQWVLRELNVDSLDQVVQTYRDIYTQKTRSYGEMDERYAILERLNAKLHKEKEELRSTYEKKIMKEFTNRRQEEARLVAREEAFKSQIQRLQEASARETRRAVTDK
jgi:hypothetical protein